MADATPEQRKAIQAFVGGTLSPLIEEVLTKKLSQAAAYLSDQIAASDNAKDAARFRFLCARPHWGFIEEICLAFAAESEAEFRQALRAEIDRRMALAPHPFGEGARNG